jgi:DNA-binding beta-propeller fold protein YncE
VTDRHVTGQIVVIDTTSDAVLTTETISTDPFPRAIGISPDGQYLFVGCIEVSGLSPGCIKMYRLLDGEAVDSVTPEDLSNPRTMAVAPTGNRIFVADHGSHVCFAFDVTYGGSPGLTEVAVARLDTQPGVDPCPVEVVVGQPPPR